MHYLPMTLPTYGFTVPVKKNDLVKDENEFSATITRIPNEEEKL